MQQSEIKTRTMAYTPIGLAVWLMLLMVPAKSLDVCADPDFLPYSNRAGEGFENRIASAVAKALGESLRYTWKSYRDHGGFSQFLSSTLDAKKCDVVIGVPYGSLEEATTRPYYVSYYVFVFDKRKTYNIASMDSPALRNLKIGFEKDTPVEEGLKVRDLIPRAVAFDVAEDTSQSADSMLRALKDGQIDVLITWQPAISRFLRAFPDLRIQPVPNERTMGSPEQYAFPISMGVRKGDDALRSKLDDVINMHQAELTSILTENGVMVYLTK